MERPAVDVSVGERGHTMAVDKIKQALHKLEDCVRDLQEAEQLMVRKQWVRITLNGNVEEKDRRRLQQITAFMREMVDEVLAKVQSNKSPTKGTIQLGDDAQQMSACAAAEPSSSVKKARRAGKWHVGTPADEEESISACNHVCVHHQEVMSTSLWANLPTHLRVMVIAWIPLAQLMGISQSKDCKAVIGVPRSFQRAWTEVSGRNFAIVTSRDEYTSFNVYGMKTETWYQSSLPLNSRSRVVATAGGLLCIAESNFYKDDNLYRISCGLPSDITFVDGFTICNPITNMWRTLPDGFQIGVAPRMIRMVMGNASKHYMLVIVGFNHNSRSLTMQVYDSQTNTWKLNDGNQGPLLGESCGSGFTECGSYEALMQYNIEEKFMLDILKQ